MASRKLDAAVSPSLNIEKINVDEKLFRWMMYEDPMATEKLSDGIRRFAADLIKLEQFLIKEFLAV